MTPTQLEFEITQWLDGDLPPHRVAALQRELKVNPQAQRLLDEYRKLDHLLNAVEPVPQTDWAALQQNIRSAVDRHRENAPLLRIRHERWTRLAVAAVVLLALGLAARLAMHPAGTPTSNNMQLASTTVQSHEKPVVTITQLANLAVASGAGPVTQIRVSQASDTQPTMQMAFNRPRIVIAPGRQPDDDTLLLAWSR